MVSSQRCSWCLFNVCLPEGRQCRVHGTCLNECTCIAERQRERGARRTEDWMDVSSREPQETRGQRSPTCCSPWGDSVGRRLATERQEQPRSTRLLRGPVCSVSQGPCLGTADSCSGLLSDNAECDEKRQEQSARRAVAVSGPGLPPLLGAGKTAAPVPGNTATGGVTPLTAHYRGGATYDPHSDRRLTHLLSSPAHVPMPASGWGGSGGWAATELREPSRKPVDRTAEIQRGK